MPNEAIRAAIRERRLKHFEVAHQLGISRCTFSVWLSEEMPKEKQKMILETIEKMKV